MRSPMKIRPEFRGNGPGSIMKPENGLTFGSKASARHWRRDYSQAHQGRAPL